MSEMRLDRRLSEMRLDRSTKLAELFASGKISADEYLKRRQKIVSLVPRVKEEVALRGYSAYFLQGNPFPYVPIADPTPIVHVDRGISDRVIDIVRVTIATGRSNHAVMIGPYGSGKTHMLRHVSRRIADDLRDTAIGCYVPHPGHSFLHVYRAFMGGISPHVLRMGEASKIVECPTPLRTALDVVRYERALRGRMEAESPREAHAMAWLRGESLSDDKLADIGIGANIDPAASVDYFTHVLRLLRQCGFKATCLLIDEFESIFELEPPLRQAFLTSLRRVIDDNPSGLCLLLACTPAGWEEISKYCYVLYRRLSRNVIHVERMAESGVLELVGRLLQRYRGQKTDFVMFVRSRWSGREAEELLSLYPFTSGAISKIYERARGNVGEVMKYLNLAIDCGLGMGYDLITAKAVGEMESAGWKAPAVPYAPPKIKEAPVGIAVPKLERITVPEVKEITVPEVKEISEDEFLEALSDAYGRLSATTPYGFRMPFVEIPRLRGAVRARL
ncbi:TPA: hypothetical protein EYP44_02880, partial [Candidatus Bathyarchaeota archaeon]|nr:hypothetical protein [Candidatus Bathyarchaeota archaeon]